MPDSTTSCALDTKSSPEVVEAKYRHFTLVFEGDIRSFKSNPLRTDTPFGQPVVLSLGDVCAERDALEDQLRGQNG